ncbi:PEGA domain-containing protein [Candidatus Saccharibacteria bacterium]|jgi:hypothetical protein|nr:PEGA domain-containing protein [Candidatus Saccharibacteria bacterium]MBP7834650.1 PEGA domain-containing protein [Candidatus Saccharibacteria bacterium]
MEFLTPEEKRNRTLRFISGYFLVAIAVLLGTFIFVLLVQGYQLNNRKGLVQNGLVNVESRPVSADIYLNGELNSRTTSRLDLNEGEYDLKLKADNYREWSKKFTLLGGQVRYFVYPKLIPNIIKTETTATYNAMPLWASESLDRHWIVSKVSGQQADFSVFDTTRTDNPATANQTITVPAAALIGSPSAYGDFQPIEWADDNKHLLLLQTLANGQKNFIVVDREKPENSLSVSKTLSLNNDFKVVLRDKKPNKFYVLNTVSGELTRRDTKNISEIVKVADGVVAFKPYGNDLVLYVTYLNTAEGLAKVVVSDNISKLYNLQPIARDLAGNYQLDMAKFDGTWYYVTSSSSDNKIRIYANPLDSIRANSGDIAKARYTLPLENPIFASFSDNARFIAVQSASNFVVYDGELKSNYRYSVDYKLAKDQKAQWMDGHRLKVVDNGMAKIFEFDGTNGQDLIPSQPNNSFTLYFDRDYNFVYTYTQDKSGSPVLQSGALVYKP